MFSLSQRALDLHLLPASDTELATIVHQHVLNSPPTEDGAQVLTHYIEEHGQADFIATVIGLHLNIDLIGMQHVGVEYV